jgi:hypothetical protein
MSQEMLNIKSGKMEDIDLYYNDLYGLKKTQF